MLYLLIKWLHVLAAITALGANITYGFWITRATRDPAVLPFTLRSIKILDDRIANPAYGVLLITGFAMAWVGQLPLRTPWLATALVLYVVMVVVAVAGYTPALKRQMAVLDRNAVSSPEYQAAAARAQRLGALLGVVVVAIVFLMVVKPALWG
ncbi:MAG TPA: DUF2269 family protein [Vicinamibacterales bacterium]|jgi:uncharacterized membrane protein|nr:DUF2269 family protein [Vicinamibacterales bacterium]